MKINANTWQTGMAQNQHLGMANLRNILIHGGGPARVLSKAQKISETPGEITCILSSPKDSSSEWIALCGESTRDITGNMQQGKPYLYESASRTWVRATDRETSYSGALWFRNYFIPFPSTPNQDVGFRKSTQEDGRFDFLGDHFASLVNKGSTQTRIQALCSGKSEFDRMSCAFDEQYWISKEGTGCVVRDTTGTLVRAIDDQESQTIRGMSKLTQNLFALIYADKIKVFDINGVHQFDYAFAFESETDSLRLLDVSYAEEGKITISYSNRFSHGNDLLMLSVFHLQGLSFQHKKLRVAPASGSNFQCTQLSSVFCDDVILVSYRNALGVSIVDIFEERHGGLVSVKHLWQGIQAFEQEMSYFMGPFERFGTGFFVLGSTARYYSIDGSSKTLSFGETGIIIPTNITHSGGNGKQIAIQADNESGCYEVIFGKLEKTAALVGSDDDLYFANGNSLAAIRTSSLVPFNPETSSSYTLQHDALDLPLGTQITALAQNGEHLLIGTQGGKLYPWDRQSDSFSFPVVLADALSSIGSKNNLMYLATQGVGNMYLSDGSSYQKIRSFSSLSHASFQCEIGDMVFIDDTLCIAVHVKNDPNYTGIWMYKDGIFSIIGTDAPIQSLAKAGTQSLVYATQEGLFIQELRGMKQAERSDESAYLVSPILRVGDVNKEDVVSSYKVYFDRQMSTDEYFIIYERNTVTGAWREVEKVEASSLGIEEGGLYYYMGSAGISPAIQRQIKIVLNTTAGFMSYEEY